MSKHDDVCPNCGYCPHCGRSNQQAIPVAPVYPWPTYPWYVQPTLPYGTTIVTGTTTVNIIHGNTSDDESMANLLRLMKVEP